MVKYNEKMQCSGCNGSDIRIEALILKDLKIEIISYWCKNCGRSFLVERKKTKGDMKMKIAFFVPGEAKTAGSKNAFLNKKTGKINVTHANPKTKVWMDTVKYFAFKEVGKMCLLTEAISLMLIFYRDRPKGHFNSKGILKESAPKYPTPKPDVTKLCRAVEDALTGIIWHDDSQVCEQYNKKLYVTNQDLPYSNKPGVQITIETME